MVKEPLPGRVKTRLARQTGTIAAAGWYRRQVLDLIHRLARNPGWLTILAVSPDRAGMSSRVWPPALPKIAQGGGTIGMRLRHIMMAMPSGPVAIIGSDIPGITTAHIERAFDLLGRCSVVFGPSPDGGFWLVGMQRSRPLARRNFRSIRWSTEHALQETIDSLPHHDIGIIDTLSDIDTFEDLQAWQRQGQAGPGQEH